MEVDSFLKSPVVIDNVDRHVNLGQWIYEDRFQWIVKETSHFAHHVTKIIIIKELESQNTMWSFRRLIIRWRPIWVRALKAVNEDFTKLSIRSTMES